MRGWYNIAHTRTDQQKAIIMWGGGVQVCLHADRWLALIPLPPQSNEYAQKALALSSGSEVDNIETLLHLLKIMADHNKPAD